MADLTLAQIEHLSQRLTHKLKNLDDLISQAWLEHELARESLRQLIKMYYEWLGKEGIQHEY